MLRTLARVADRRLAASALAIALGVAFTCATLLLGSSLERGYARQVAGWLQDASVIVQPAATLGPDAVAQLAAVPGVTAVDPRVDHWAMFDRDQYARVRSQPVLSEHTRLVSGRLADAPGELAVNEAFAASGRLELGSTLTSFVYPEEPAPEEPAPGETDPGETDPGEAAPGEPAPGGTNPEGTAPAGTGGAGNEPVVSEAVPGPSFTVVGIVAPGLDTTDGPTFPEAYAPSEYLMELAGGYRTVLVSGSDAPEVLAERLAASPVLAAEGTEVRTAAEFTANTIDMYTQGTRATTTLLLTFSVIAFAVTALVIANTFGILVAQRTRQLALLRCVGASRGQVFRHVVGEAALVAAMAGVGGVALGVGLVAVLPLVLPQVASYTTVAPTAMGLLAPWLAGIVVAVAAAAVPARAATRVPPLAALRPALAASGVRAVGRGRLAAGALFLLGGTGLLVFAVWASKLEIGLAGGVASFVGLLLLGPIVIPALAGLLARPWRRGIVGRLAAENTARNPHRAATTAGALLIGTTLVTMVLVGAATAQTTTTAAIDRRFPVDILGQGNVTPGARDAAAAVPGVSGAVLVSAADITVQGSENAELVATGLVATGLGPDDVAAIGWQDAAAGLTDDTIVLPRSAGFADGETVDVIGTAGTVTLTVRSVPQAGLVAVAPATITRLSDHPERLLYVATAFGADPNQVMGDLQNALSGDGLWFSSASAARASITDAVALALQIVLGLLAVSVAISWVGIGNTLGLSVLERTRETALLRALGLERRGVRQVLGTEALLLGAVAAVLGAALGVGYGLAGVSVLLGARTPLAVDIPWWQVGVVAGLTLASAWLASVLPARRAALVSPAAALADD